MSNVFIMGTILAPLTRKNRTLPRNAWLPYDTNTSFRYWVSYFHQVLAISLLLNNTVATIWIILGFMHQVSCQFVILRRRLVKFTELIKLLRDARKSRAFVRSVEKNFVKEIVKNHLYLFKLGIPLESESLFRYFFFFFSISSFIYVRNKFTALLSSVTNRSSRVEISISASNFSF